MIGHAIAPKCSHNGDNVSAAGSSAISVEVDSVPALADLIYDPVGGELAEPALRSVAWKGRYLVIGFAGGDIPRIPLNLPLLKGCSVVGVFWGSFSQRERDLQRQNVTELWRLFEAGQLSPVVGETHALEDYAAAFAALGGRQAHGKVVLLP